MKNVLCFLLSAGLQAVACDLLAAPNESQVERHHCDIYGCSVEWHRAYPHDVAGDRVTIKGGGKPYTLFLADRDIVSVSEWRAPENDAADPDDSEVNGVMLRCGFPTGTSREYIILAHLHGNRWKRVFDACIAYDHDKHGPEFVDLDGDAVPEIVVTPNFWPIFGDAGVKAGVKEMTSQIWKWSPARKSYILKKTRPYLKRLRPL